MPANLATISVGSTNISSRVAFGAAHVAGGDRYLTLIVSLSGLNGAAATLTPDVEITRGGNAIGLSDVRYSVAKRSATATRIQITVGPFRVLNNDSVQLFLASSNASDTAVSGTVYVDRWQHADTVDAVTGTVAANVVTINALPAAGLGLMNDFYAENHYFNANVFRVHGDFDAAAGLASMGSQYDAAGHLHANVARVGGQTANAAAPVAFPATVGSSTYAGGDTPGTTTLLSRVTAPITTAAQQTQDVTNLLSAVQAVPGLTWAYTDGARTLSSFGTLATDVAAIAGKLTGITSLAQWLRATLRKSTPDATALAEINAGGGTYNVTTDSAQATAEAVGDIVTTTTDPTLVLSGTAQTGAATSITLAAGASAQHNLYVGLPIHISAGAGVGQVRTVIAYNGTTKIATVDRPWIVIPDATSVYKLRATVSTKLNSALQVAAVTTTASTNSASGVVSAGRTSNYSARTHYYWSEAFTLTGVDSTGWTEFVWTLKATADDDDADALLTIKVTDPASAAEDGLTVFNAAPADGPMRANATLAIDTTGGNTVITWTIEAPAMVLPDGTYEWEAARYKPGATVRKEPMAFGKVLLSQALLRATVAP